MIPIKEWSYFTRRNSLVMETNEEAVMASVVMARHVSTHWGNILLQATCHNGFAVWIAPRLGWKTLMAG